MLGDGLGIRVSLILTKENLSITLEDNGIQYIWFESLGGYRSWQRHQRRGYWKMF
ncbi:hypothetical protein SUSAZ_05880 [Sulfolobus acidocaldarius SUSAZ]|nr:hypothetical protein SUSAZ_05880 [Sulfolobus acidocaldarius SUSAZ]